MPANVLRFPARKTATGREVSVVIQAQDPAEAAANALAAAGTALDVLLVAVTRQQAAAKEALESSQLRLSADAEIQRCLSHAGHDRAAGGMPAFVMV